MPEPEGTMINTCPLKKQKTITEVASGSYVVNQTPMVMADPLVLIGIVLPVIHNSLKNVSSN